MSDDALVLQVDEDITVLMVADLGPQGQSGAVILTREAGSIIQGHRAIYIDAAGLAQKADKDDPAKVDVIGLNVAAVIAGEDVEIFSFIEITEPSFSFSPGLPVYLGNDGLLTQVVPVTGFLVTVGVATGVTKILVEPEPPIALA